MIQLITRYLSENNYTEVAMKLQTESNNKLYTDLYTHLNRFISQSEYQNGLSAIKKEIDNQKLSTNDDDDNIEMLILIYNSLFLRYLYSSFESLDNTKLINEVQDHMTNISLFVSDNIKIKPSKFKRLKTDLEAMKTSLASILFSKNTDGLIKKFPQIISNDTLLLYINKQYYQNVFGSDLSLEQLIEEVYKYQTSNCYYHNCKHNRNQMSYYNNHNCSKAQLIPNKIGLSIDTEQEVQNIIYSNTGKYFAVILSNKSIIIYTLINNKRSIEITETKVITNRHSDTITSLCWNKNDTLILTTSKDKTIKLFNPFNGQCNTKYDIHDAMVIYATFIYNDTHFASCGLDYRINITSIEGAKEWTIRLPGISVSEVLYSQLYNTLIIVAVTSNTILFYDLNQKIEQNKILINDAIISCSISKTDKGKYLLVNSSKATPVLILINIEDGSIIRKFFGHRQERLTIKCNFGGFNENFIVCGSENANVYVWNKNCSIPIVEIKAHSSSVNSVIWPFYSMTDIILSCSDDHTITVIKNEEVEKLYYNHSKKLENKMVNLEENNVMPLPNHNLPDPSSVATNILSRLTGILRHIGYGSDNEDESEL